MILYNTNIFKEDPLYKFHFEEFDSDELIIHLGYNQGNLNKIDNRKHVLIELEQPNRFFHPSTQNDTFICENFYDKILTINPEFVKNRNKQLGKDLYEHVFFPYSENYILENTEKKQDIIYTGNKDYFNILGKYNNVIWVGNNGNVRNIPYLEKIKLTSESKISISHSIVEFKDLIHFMDTHHETVKHIDGIFEQHKARTIEAAFNKCIIIHIDTGQKLIEEFFEEGKEFLYYQEGIIEEVLNNYDNYKILAENAYNKAINNYTTKHFYNNFLKPLI
jgi:hypothetical protein